MSSKLKELRVARGLSQEVLADRSGISPAYYSRIERGERPLNKENARKIAPALGVTVAELLLTDEEIKRALTKFKPLQEINERRPVYIKGEVAAGVWVEAIEREQDDWEKVELPTLGPYSEMPQFALKVRGPSMNKIFADGAIILCVKYIDIGYEPENNDLVIAIRKRSDGLLEATCKRLKIDGEGTSWLWPESTDPNHQSPVPLAPEGDIEEVLVYARVVLSLASH